MASFNLPPPLTNTDVVLRDLGDIRIYVNGSDAVATADLEGSDPIDLLTRAIDVIVEQNKIVVAVDVGCNYGIQLCRLAKYICSASRDHKIFALDPGTASALVPFNLLKNNLFFDVEFIRAAASSKIGSLEIYTSDNNSLNDSILQLPDQKLSWIAAAVTLEFILDSIKPSVDGPVIVKIDTQGADPEVLLGAGKYLPQLIFISELTPWASAKRVDLSGFLNDLMKTHVLYNLATDRSTQVFIADVDTFLDNVYRTAPYWTDILGVPRKFEFLIEEFRKSET